jgi:hypothetical protein
LDKQRPPYNNPLTSHGFAEEQLHKFDRVCVYGAEIVDQINYVHTYYATFQFGEHALARTDPRGNLNLRKFGLISGLD